MLDSRILILGVHDEYTGYVTHTLRRDGSYIARLVVRKTGRELAWSKGHSTMEAACVWLRGEVDKLQQEATP